jgi:hypothetical protein
MLSNKIKPSLFGLDFTNRDFSKPNSWGKNQFNTSFPASLACYMHSKGLNPVYLELDESKNIVNSEKCFPDLFGLAPLSEELYFAFETSFSVYATYAKGIVPRADLVIMNRSSKPSQLVRALEVKLTALPDNTTYKLSQENYGCEIVIRPDTIVYLALGLAQIYNNERNNLMNLLGVMSIKDWEEINDVLPHIESIIEAIDRVLITKKDHQSPFLMQPIWKTEGKSQRLAEQCFDMFIWSDFGFTRLFVNTALQRNAKGITRSARSVIWLFKMLSDFAEKGSIDFKNIIDRLTYNTKNDKAFAVSGTVTNPFMRCSVLINPRVNRNAIKEIILGGGQHYLSPERRLDAAILSTPGLFDDTEDLFIDSENYGCEDAQDEDNEDN